MTVYNHTVAPVISGGDPVSTTKTYAVNEAFLVNIPATGKFLDINSTAVANDSSAFFVVPGGGLSGIADPANPTVAEIALLDVVDGPDHPLGVVSEILTGTTDADAITQVPYASTPQYGFTAEIEQSNGVMRIPGDSPAGYEFAVYYWPAQARFELTNVGVQLQNRPYRILIYKMSSDLLPGYEVAKYTGTLVAGPNTTISITVPAGKIIVDYQVLVNFSGTSWLNPSYYNIAAFYAQIVADDVTESISMNSIGTSLQGRPYRCLVTFAN